MILSIIASLRPDHPPVTGLNLRAGHFVVQMVLSPAHPHEKRIAFRLIGGTIFGEEREVSGVRPAGSDATHVSRRERFGKNALHPDRIMDLRINSRSNFPHAPILSLPCVAFISRKHGMRVGICYLERLWIQPDQPFDLRLPLFRSLSGRHPRFRKCETIRRKQNTEEL